jgi:lipopolysaccharide export LptBFGC system permease protein LptF
MTRRSPRSLFVALVTAVLVLVLAPAATPHSSPVHWIKLTKGTSSSVRSTSFNHGTFTLDVIAYFGKVTRTTAYLDHVTYTTCPDNSINGGLLFAYNSNASYRYNADSGHTYFSCGTRTTQIDHTFTGGYSNGNIAITFEKRNMSPYCAPAACEMHWSYAVFYVAP